MLFLSNFHRRIREAPACFLTSCPPAAALARTFAWCLSRVQGTVYLSGHGSEDRMSLVPLRDDANGVVTSMVCIETHGEHLLPENVEFCEALKDQYEADDYDELMNTTFGLVPAGRSPGTYRLGEVMSAGSIPVFIGRDLVPPFVGQLDWPSFSFSFAPDQVGPEMMQTLRALSRSELESMQVMGAYVKPHQWGCSRYVDTVLHGPCSVAPSYSDSRGGSCSLLV